MGDQPSHTLVDWRTRQNKVAFWFAAFYMPLLAILSIAAVAWMIASEAGRQLLEHWSVGVVLAVAISQPAILLAAMLRHTALTDRAEVMTRKKDKT